MCLMCVPTSEVGYTTAMPKRENHEVHKDMWWYWIKYKHIYFKVQHIFPYSSTSYRIIYNGKR
jgi:hypothetical protein